ncbi:MAG TPA: M20/M25/M40 family metallo-hydrolase [Pyrinomonadaceae bacterium]|nr:M20/M25/M40 family metallo-hydrolase [Pyrinomonadaceae bacterium]
MNLPLGRATLALIVSLLITASVPAQSPVLEQNVRAELNFLASDAMQGRGSGTTYERIAAEYVGSQFRQFGLEPGGDADANGNKGFVQRVALESARVVETWNVIGILRGSDPAAATEAIVLSAHLDHLGVSDTLAGDKIFNGADDDASGCVAVLELARALAAGKRPRRTIYFVGFGSEERGGYGSRYFRDNPPVPLTQIVANLNFEMLGRPDPKVGADKVWLTGYERSNLGPELAKQGAALVADPHPEQHFFQRSDNYSFALRGVIAQTVSSFGLHTDYHRVTDEVSKVDFPFMTRAINSMVKPIQWLADSTFRPEWLPGQAPTRN